MSILYQCDCILCFFLVSQREHSRLLVNTTAANSMKNTRYYCGRSERGGGVLFFFLLLRHILTSLITRIRAPCDAQGHVGTRGQKTTFKPLRLCGERSRCGTRWLNGTTSKTGASFGGIQMRSQLKNHLDFQIFLFDCQHQIRGMGKGQSRRTITTDITNIAASQDGVWGGEKGCHKGRKRTWIRVDWWFGASLGTLSANPAVLVGKRKNPFYPTWYPKKEDFITSLQFILISFFLSLFFWSFQNIIGSTFAQWG